MPPVRLDAPSWRDRVRGPRARRLEAARGWFGRVGQAATAAIALTVVGALGAVLITRPPVSPGTTAAPTGVGSPAPSGAASTSLPKLFLEGDPPAPSTVLVRTERGEFSLVDLSTGQKGGDLTGAVDGSSVQQRADGTLLCLCVKVSGNVNGSATDAEVTVDRFDRSGELVSTVSVATLSGEPDPRDGAIPERPPHIGFTTSFSAGGRYGFIGWSERAHPVWRSGVIVVDLADDRVVSRLELPEADTGEDDTRRVVLGPLIMDTGGRVAIAREAYSWSPPESAGENFRSENAAYRADLDGAALVNLASVDVLGCGDRVLRAGAVPGSGDWWLACVSFMTGNVVVRRFDAAGGMLGDTGVAVDPAVDGDVTAMSPDGRALLVWNAVSATLTRIDLATGTTTEGHASAAVAARRPLAVVADWLAPMVAAKTFLDGGVVVSPDGSRVYAAGVHPAVAADVGGSSGIFVFDATTLENLARWDPTADVVSLAVSSDGRSLYAAGLPEVDATGTSRPDQQASITVYSAGDGSVRLIAGQLGLEVLTFVAPTVD